MAYDALTTARPVEGKKDYLNILKLAADQGQARVESVLRSLLDTQQALRVKDIAELVAAQNMPSPPAEVRIAPVDLSVYDTLLAAPLECAQAAEDRNELEVRHA